MAYNTEPILVDKDGNPISQYYNPATGKYEPLEGEKGANKVILYNEDGTENNSLSLIPILDKLSQLAGTVVDEQTRKSNELQRLSLYNTISQMLDNGEFVGEQGIQGEQGETGKGLEFNWSGTLLGVRVEGQTNYVYIELKGLKGDTGSIDNLTSVHVTTALGYSPVSPTQLNEKVLTDVPVGAKFTDTVYTHPTGTNPHATTKSDVGLGNLDNTSDANKPVSSTQQTALNLKADKTQVLTDVPVNAKFTDTVYTHPATHPASIIAQDINNRLVSDAEKTNWNNKAEKKQTFTVALAVENWSGTAPFTQTVSVTGITSVMNPLADIVLSETDETAIAELDAWSMINKIETLNSSISVTCYFGKPETNMTIRLIEVM